jgi:DNA-damage-inducible protein D
MEFAVLTNELSKGTFGLTVQAHRLYKQLPVRENVRDHMSRMELILCSLSEETAIQLHQEHESQGFPALKGDVTIAGQTAGEARKVVERRIGKSVVSSENFLAPPRAGKSVNQNANTQRSSELPQSTLFDEPRQK